MGSRIGQFNSPHGLCLAGEAVAVADTHNHRVQVLALDGRFMYSFGEPGARASVTAAGASPLLVVRYNCE